MTKAVIFDIDGTLADCSHRLHHVTGGNKRWDQFFATMGEDACYAVIRDLVEMCREGDYRILLCSGRPDNYRDVTVAWLDKNDVFYDQLYMRPAGDFRADRVVKSQLLDGIMSDGYEPHFVVDDRPSVVSMWRERGLTCLQCRDWHDDKPAVSTATLTLMIGPSGAGKSTFLASERAREFGIHHSHVLSSDQIRADICGDFKDQTQNDAVFAALHATAKTRLSHGLPVVVDATNLRRKDRMECAELAAKGPVRYIVIDRPLEEKKRDGGWRNELGFDLYAKHDQTFRSQIKDILRGDDLPNVEVIDLRAAK